MKKKLKERAAAGAVAAVASAGVLVGGVFTSPSELLDDEDYLTAPAVVDTVDNDDAGAGAPDGEDEEEETMRRRGFRAACRAWVRGLPMAVRAVVGVPLWCVGFVILTALSTLWTGVLSPLAGTVVGWICAALLMLGVFAMTAKAVFPDVPLKKILNRRSILGVVIGVGLVGIADAALPLFWEEYDGISNIVRLVGAFAAVLVPTVLFSSREIKKRRREAAEAALAARRVSKEEEQAAALAYVRELADSVC